MVLELAGLTKTGDTLSTLDYEADLNQSRLNERLFSGHKSFA